MLEFLVFLVFTFLRLFVDFQEAVELEHGTGNPEPECVVPGFRINVDGSLVENCGVNLRSHKALPDQLVDFVFIFF